jgi:hypothetical protein
MQSHIPLGLVSLFSFGSQGDKENSGACYFSFFHPRRPKQSLQCLTVCNKSCLGKSAPPYFLDVHGPHALFSSPPRLVNACVYIHTPPRPSRNKPTVPAPTRSWFPNEYNTSIYGNERHLFIVQPLFHPSPMHLNTNHSLDTRTRTYRQR